jgi:ABC transporter substrate binding protein
MSAHVRELAALALQYRLPSIYRQKAYTAAGGLMSYGPEFETIIRRSADYVDKIPRGERPANLPIEQPTYFEFVVNLKTAKTLELAVPQCSVAPTSSSNERRYDSFRPCLAVRDQWRQRPKTGHGPALRPTQASDRNGSSAGARGCYEFAVGIGCHAPHPEPPASRIVRLPLLRPNIIPAPLIVGTRLIL